MAEFQLIQQFWLQLDMVHSKKKEHLKCRRMALRSMHAETRSRRLLAGLKFKTENYLIFLKSDSTLYTTLFLGKIDTITSFIPSKFYISIWIFELLILYLTFKWLQMFTLVTYIIFENVTSFVSFCIQDLIQLACQLLKQPQLCQEFWESVSTSFSVFVRTVFLRQKKLSLICVPYFCCNIKEDYPTI